MIAPQLESTSACQSQQCSSQASARPHQSEQQLAAPWRSQPATSVPAAPAVTALLQWRPRSAAPLTRGAPPKPSFCFAASAASNASPPPQQQSELPYPRMPSLLDRALSTVAYAPPRARECRGGFAAPVLAGAARAHDCAASLLHCFQTSSTSAPPSHQHALPEPGPHLAGRQQIPGPLPDDRASQYLWSAPLQLHRGVVPRQSFGDGPRQPAAVE
mmetsp:Transcript_11931/g.27856  ORF Transcript_11931/g.27856 Transcript_11931/m.27856 type:complete len:216 (-) Transcript_11931:414-1061(-)